MKYSGVFRGRAKISAMESNLRMAEYALGLAVVPASTNQWTKDDLESIATNYVSVETFGAIAHLVNFYNKGYQGLTPAQEEQYAKDAEAKLTCSSLKIWR